MSVQVLMSVVVTAADEFSPAAASWYTRRDVLYFLEIICSCAVLFPIGWRFDYLHNAFITEGKAKRRAPFLCFQHTHMRKPVWVGTTHEAQ